MTPLHRLTRPLARFAQRWRAHAGMVQGVFAVLAFALGLWGWTLHRPPAGLTDHANNLFRTLQLITLQFPTQFDGSLPWQLHIARLLVPLAVLAASLHIVIGAATRPARLALMPNAKNHVIVGGADQLTASALTRLAETDRRQVVTLGPPMDPGRRETLEALGLTIVEGDAREPATLTAIGLANAAALSHTPELDFDRMALALVRVRILDGAVVREPRDASPRSRVLQNMAGLVRSLTQRRILVPVGSPERLRLSHPAIALVWQRLHSSVQRNEAMALLEEELTLRAGRWKAQGLDAALLPGEGQPLDDMAQLLMIRWDGLDPLLRAYVSQALERVRDQFLKVNSTTRCTPMAIAASLGDLDLMQRLRHRGADLELGSDIGSTPLSFAAIAGQLAAIRLLLDWNAKPDAPNQFGSTPLMYAAANGHSGIVASLLPIADPARHGEHGAISLHWAAQAGHEAIVQLLLGVHASGAQARDKHQQTPLHLAAAGGHDAVVRLLLAVDPDGAKARNDQKKTPLHLAAETGHDAVVRLLLAVDPDGARARSNRKDTPLHLAAETGHDAVVRLLLEADPDGAKATDAHQLTPLHLAAGRGHDAVVRLLLAVDPDGAKARSNRKDTPLHLAAEVDNDTIVRLLLTDDSVQAQARNELQAIPLHVAAACDNEATARLLLLAYPDGAQAKADRRVKGMTPLHIAALRGNQTIARLLMSSCPAGVQAKAEHQVTPLHLAAISGDEATVKLLLSAHPEGARARSEDQCTPLHFAAAEGHEAVARLLLSAYPDGAKARNCRSSTPLHYAVAEGNQAITQMLLEEYQAGVEFKALERYMFGFIAEIRGHPILAAYLRQALKVGITSRIIGGVLTFWLRPILGLVLRATAAAPRRTRASRLSEPDRVSPQSWLAKKKPHRTGQAV